MKKEWIMFFFFDEIGRLAENNLVKDAFEKTIFTKICTEGYCDINPLLGRTGIKKSDITSYLKQKNSPLYTLFSKNYVKSIEDCEKRMLPILTDMEREKTSGNNEYLDDCIYFCIIYYLFHIYNSSGERLDLAKKLCMAWNIDNKEYSLKIENGIVFDEAKVEITFISTINQYVDYLKTIEQVGKKLFYRGHSKLSYKLKPSIFRKEEWRFNEKKMYLELITKCPIEFESLDSHIEKLAEMQHYGLPTRLLDLTMNSLVALYFACESNQSFYGEIIIISQDADSIKYFHSDTVAVLASLPLFTKDEQQQFYSASCGCLNEVAFNEEVERLVHEVRMERPGFKSIIKKEDLRKSIICIPARKNKRLDNQEGAFIICGLLDEIYGEENRNSLSDLRLKLPDGKKSICIVKNKANILNELDKVGINKAKIYPEIDDVADYIKTKIGKTL